MIGAAAIIGGAASIAGGIFGSARAKKQQRAANKRLRQLNAKLSSLEANEYENEEGVKHLCLSPLRVQEKPSRGDLRRG